MAGRRSRRQFLALTAVGLLAGCGSLRTSSSPSPSSDDGLVVWQRLRGGEGMPPLTQAAYQFGRSHPGSTVTIHDAPTTTAAYLADLRRVTRSGRGPCLAQVPNTAVTGLAQAGVLDDVTQTAEQYRDSYARGPMSRVTYRGRTYGLPLDSSPLVLFHDVDAWTKAGVDVPTTWQQMEAAATRLRTAGLSLTDVPIDDASWYAALCDACGCPWFRAVDDTTWQIGIDTAEAVAFASGWRRIVQAGGLPSTHGWDADATTSAFSSGKVVGHIGAPGEIPDLLEAVRATGHRWAVSALPTGGEGSNAGDGRVASYAGSSWVALTGCAHPDEALAFADVIGEDTSLLAPRGLVPAASVDSLTTPSSWSDVFGDDDVMSTLSDLGGRIAQDSSPSPAWPAVAGAWASVKGTLLGSGSVEKALGRIADAARTRIEGLGLKVS